MKPEPCADQVIGARHDIPLYNETCFLTSWTARCRAGVSTFDGAAEITTAELMTRHPSGSGVARPMRWDFHSEAAGTKFRATGEPSPTSPPSTEARVQPTLPDGTVGHAHLERSSQRSLLSQT